MKFQTKIMLINFAVVLLLVAAMGLFFNRYLIGRLQDTARQDIQSIANTVSLQFDETVKSMEFISDHLLADTNTLSAMRTLSNPLRDDISPNYILDAKTQIRASIITFPISRNYYRVSFFNRNGDFITSNTSAPSIPDDSADLDLFPDIDRVDEEMGRFVLLPPHADPWDTGGPPQVYSLVRAVGGNIVPSYIEVQNLYSDLEQLYGGDTADQIALIDGHGNWFFSQLTAEQEALVLDSFAEGPPASASLGDYIVASSYSDYSGIYTITLRGNDVIRETIRQVNLITGLALAAVCAVSILILHIASVRVTQPIRQLTAQIQSTDLDNLDASYAIEDSNDDMKLLSESYKQLLQRLTQSIAKEDELRTLQTKAEFNALQAQVNPHFIFNVLNVISYKGMTSGDESICTICSSLAGMLRYSTDTNRTLVSVREELDYVEKYIYLLEARFQDMIECTIDVESAVLNQQIPKVILQQMVENAVNHGFRNSSDRMRIHIEGHVREQSWTVAVSDNGSGFAPDRLQEIRRQMSTLREKAEISYINLNTEIGGMGLINTYARLLLTFGTAAQLQIDNRTGGGARITITAPCVNMREE